MGFTRYHSSQALTPPPAVMLADLTSYLPEKYRDQLARWTTFPLKPTPRTFETFSISILSSSFRELGYSSFLRGVSSSAFNSPTLSHQETCSYRVLFPHHCTDPLKVTHTLGLCILMVYSPRKWLREGHMMMFCPVKQERKFGMGWGKRSSLIKNRHSRRKSLQQRLSPVGRVKPRSATTILQLRGAGARRCQQGNGQKLLSCNIIEPRS